MPNFLLQLGYRTESMWHFRGRAAGLYEGHWLLPGHQNYSVFTPGFLPLPLLHLSNQSHLTTSKFSFLASLTASVSSRLLLTSPKHNFPTHYFSLFFFSCLISANFSIFSVSCCWGNSAIFLKEKTHPELFCWCSSLASLNHFSHSPDAVSGSEERW